ATSSYCSVHLNIRHKRRNELVRARLLHGTLTPTFLKREFRLIQLDQGYYELLCRSNGWFSLPFVAKLALVNNSISLLVDLLREQLERLYLLVLRLVDLG